MSLIFQKILNRIVAGALVIIVFLVSMSVYEIYIRDWEKAKEEIKTTEFDILNLKNNIRLLAGNIQSVSRDLKELEDKIGMFTRTWAWLTLWGENYEWWERQTKRAEALLKKKNSYEDQINDLKQNLQNKNIRLNELNEIIKNAPGVIKIIEYIKKLFWEYLWLIILFVILFIFPFGEWMWKMFWWYGPAALSDRYGSPIVFNTNSFPLTAADFCSEEKSQKLKLVQGEEGVFRPETIQVTDKDEQSKTDTVLLFDWHYPFLCLACHLFLLLRLRTSEQNVYLTLAGMEHTHKEFSLIQLKEGASVIIRPFFIAGLIYPHDRKPVIRSHWFLSNWYSWLTLQFRYIEITGPVKLVVWGYKHLRVEKPALELGMINRVNPDSVIGFCPSLTYRMQRSETLGTYLFGSEPLFNDTFSGKGVYICQEAIINPAAKGIRRLWAAFLDNLLRVAGI